MLVVFKKIGKHEISIDTKSTNGRSEETFLFLSGVIVAWGRGLDISERSLFSLYFSTSSIVNLLFSSWNTYIASCFMQNPC